MMNDEWGSEYARIFIIHHSAFITFFLLRSQTPAPQDFGDAPRLRDACIGQLSEIFDAEPPHHARGCVAQAWSVAEFLRAWARTDAAAKRADPPAAREGGEARV